MKKMILAAALFLMSLCFGGDMHAGNFGVCGGANFHTYNLGNIGSGTHTQWHAGFVYKFNLPLGFQIQPSLLYDVKAATSDSMPVDLSVGYIDLNASFQWGPDLILFRPYVEVCPFAGYGVNGWGIVASPSSAKTWTPKRCTLQLRTIGECPPTPQSI